MLSELKTLLDLLCPRKCALCRCSLDNSALEESSTTLSSTVVCDNCTPTALSPEYICDTCGEAVTSPAQNQNKRSQNQQPRLPQSTKCLICQLLPLNLLQLRSLWANSGNTERLIKEMKYNFNHSLDTFFARELAEFAKQEFANTSFDLLLSVPSNGAHLRKRGFSHLTMIARKLGKHLNIPFSPLALFNRQKRLNNRNKRQAQAQLPIRERAANVSGTFRASNVVRGKSILLLDDIVTSGCSLQSAAEELYRAGALSVSGLTIARSPHFSRNRLRVIISAANENYEKCSPDTSNSYYRPSS